MSTLELNIKAKRVAPPPPVNVAPHEGEWLVAGKKYLTNANEEVLLEEIPFDSPYAEQPWLMAKAPWGQLSYYFWNKDGLYIGQGPKGEHSIRREWTETWEWEEAWMAGKELEIFNPLSGKWELYYPHHYKVIQDAFGANSTTTREFWAKQYHGALLGRKLRIK